MVNLGNVFILGDSYSTFKGYIPEDCGPWYAKKIMNDTDVDKVEQTWWHKLISETGSQLVQNCSSSGTTICNTGYDGADCSQKSFIGRLERRISNNFFEGKKIDTFIIFGGTNDSWANSPLGELKYENWNKKDLFSVLPAFCYLLDRVRGILPDTHIICIINTELKDEISENFAAACGRYGADVIKLHDISKTYGHPNIVGMEQIKDQILEYFE